MSLLTENKNGEVSNIIDKAPLKKDDNQLK